MDENSAVVDALLHAQENSEKAVKKTKNKSSSDRIDPDQTGVTASRRMIGRTDKVWNKEKRRYEYHRTRPRTEEKSEFTKYVIVVKRNINKDGFPSGVEVEIRGRRLQKALQQLNKDTKEFGFEADPPEIDPNILYHSVEGLEGMLASALNTEPPDEDYTFELRAAILYVHEDFADTFSSLRTLLPKFQINFEHLWTLYPPNQVVYTVNDVKELQAYRVRTCRLGKDNSGVPVLLFDLEYIESDGIQIGWARQRGTSIRWFPGVCSIGELSIIPLGMGLDLKAELISRGRAALKRHGRQLVEYQGLGLTKEDREWVRFNTDSRLMLDPASWVKLRPNDQAVPSIDPIDKKTVETDEDLLMLMSGYAYGYSLEDQVWGKFSIHDAREVDWDDRAFESLVLDPKIKSFIHDLVRDHHRTGGPQSKNFTDFVRNKGTGLIGLLSGPPGVGKTLTAEAIAESSRRPLYKFSSGALGHDPTAISAKLKEILKLAELWAAVVLLDEADVFLAARDGTDLARNAVVCVFLKELEYCHGIVVLTTNRATGIDAAFGSRIHFRLTYPDLDSAGRRAIWKGFVERAREGEKKGEEKEEDAGMAELRGDGREEGIRVEIGEGELTELAGLELNGRQIKNAMNVAQTVAMGRKGRVLEIGVIRTAVGLQQ